MDETGDGVSVGAEIFLSRCCECGHTFESPAVPDLVYGGRVCTTERGRFVYMNFLEDIVYDPPYSRR